MSTFQFRSTPNEESREGVVGETVGFPTETPKHIEPEEEPTESQKDHGTQKDFESHCESQIETNKTATILRIKIPLKEDLDLAFLDKGAAGTLKEIHFDEPGKISHLKNIPDTVEVLKVPHQRLKYMDLPKNLVELWIDENEMESLDLGKTPKLQVLHASQNRLHTVANLPASMVEIRLLHNPKLALLDLEAPSRISNSLKILETDPHVVLKNVADYTALQESTQKSLLKEHQEGGGPKKKAADAAATPKAIKISYGDALNRYYEYKNQYEIAVKRFNKNAKQKGQGTDTKKKAPKYPPCIKCREAVGMTFQKDGTRLSAKCGVGKVYGCDFRIELNTGEFGHLIADLELANQEFESNKATLTKMKMDNLFGYERDQDTLKRVQKEMRVYKQNTKLTAALLEKYRQILGEDVQKEHELDGLEREFLEQKIKYEELMDGFKKDPMNHELLDAAMEFYVTKVRETGVKIHRTVYPTIDMTWFKVKKDDLFVGNEKEATRMYQSHVVPRDYYTYEIEKPEVLVFQ